MQKCSNDNNSKCDHCGFAGDNLQLLTKCSRIQKIWTHYQPITNKTNRINLYCATTFTHAKRQKCK